MNKFDLTKLSNRQRIILTIVAVLLVLGLTYLVSRLAMPYIHMLEDPETQARFEAWVESLGVLGIGLMLLIQIAQIVIAFIPGEIVQVVAGVMYGTWGGLLLCLFGCVLASSIVFIVIRKLGEGFVHKIFNEESLSSFSFLRDSERLETLVFILFLIPGLPKDLLTYVVPLTQISLKSFIVLSTIGRIPGMVASTLIGSSITNANWPLIIGIFVVVGIIGLLTIWKRDDLMAWAKRMGHVRQNIEQSGKQ